MMLILKKIWRDQEIHTNSYLAIDWIYLDQNIIMRPFIVPERESGKLDLLILPFSAHQYFMIGQCICYRDLVGF